MAGETTDPVTVAELRAWAAPQCHECGRPVVRVETRWDLQWDGWVPGPTFMVCGNDHRVPVEPLA